MRGICLDIPAGALVAVTGPVGSGKSALARALLGLYPLDSGQVLLDGCPLEEIPAAQRAVRTGYLAQDPYLFSGSVRENILPGSATSDAARSQAVLQAAVSCAALEEDLGAFPAGLDTEIGELGVRVSGGQRQRIALGRAITASGSLTPGLLVLDDPFSALDLDTEAKVVAGLRHLFGPLKPYEQRSTIILLSHRLSAFPQADLVVVLNDGQIVEQGTHAELSEAKGIYARIYRAQRLVEQGGVTEVDTP